MNTKNRFHGRSDEHARVETATTRTGRERRDQNGAGRIRDRRGASAASMAGPRGGGSANSARTAARLVLDAMEAGGDAGDYARANHLLAAQDRFGLGIGVDADLIEDVRRRIDHVLLRIAFGPAATPGDVLRRSRLFVRHQGGEGDIVGAVLAHALERDRRRHGLSLADIA